MWEAGPSDPVADGLADSCSDREESLNDFFQLPTNRSREVAGLRRSGTWRWALGTGGGIKATGEWRRDGLEAERGLTAESTVNAEERRTPKTQRGSAGKGIRASRHPDIETSRAPVHLGATASDWRGPRGKRFPSGSRALLTLSPGRLNGLQ